MLGIQTKVDAMVQHFSILKWAQNMLQHLETFVVVSRLSTLSCDVCDICDVCGYNKGIRKVKTINIENTVGLIC